MKQLNSYPPGVEETRKRKRKFGLLNINFNKKRILQLKRILLNNSICKQKSKLDIGADIAMEVA